MIVRPAMPDDVERIVEVWFDSARHHAELSPERCHLPPRESIVERYRGGEQFPPGVSECITLVAETEAGVVGFIDAWISTPFDPMVQPMRYCFIADLAVAESQRSSGIGEQLLRGAEEWSKTHDARYVVLEVNDRNTRAIDFYARIGYESAARTLIRWI
jgi:ribosomal protein S18 acetylase RimI-like enzyme